MRSKKMKIKKFREIFILAMIIAIITGIYINIRKSKAEEANGILVKIEDIEGKISEQRMLIAVTENEDGTYIVKIPNKINENKIINLYTESEEVIEIETTENEQILTLSKDKTLDNNIKLKAVYIAENENINMLKVTGTEVYTSGGFLGNQDINRRSIESITFESSTSEASSATYLWDVSESGDNSVIAWYTETSEPYNVHIGSTNGKIYANPDSSYLFANIGADKICTKSNVINGLNNLDTSKVTNMSNMFLECGYYSMTSLDLGDNFYTNNVTNMSGMFYECGIEKMTNLNLGDNFDTSNVTDMNFMFYACGYMSLSSLHLGDKFDTSKVTNMNSMFHECGTKELTSVSLGNKFDTSNVTDMDNMFYFLGYTSMTNLYLGSKFTNIATANKYMFDGCGTTQSATINISPIIYKSETEAYLNSSHNEIIDISSKTNAKFYTDSIAPTIKVSPESVIKCKSTSITILIIDEEEKGLSTNNSYQYYLSSSSIELTDGSWTTYTSGTAFTIGNEITGTRYLFIKRVSNINGIESKGEGTEITIGGTTYQRFGEYVFDNTEPIVRVEYENQDKNVEVKIIANEEIQEINDWILLENKKELSRIYEKDTVEDVIVRDLVGNETKVSIEVKISKELEIKSEKYIIDLEKSEYIKGVRVQTEAKDFLNNIETNAESIVIRDKDGNEVKDTSIIGTGMTINFNNGERVLTIVVTGDINGDGIITASDVSKLKSAIIGKKTLEGAYKEAGDLKEDEEIKGSDLSRLKKMIIGL